MSMQASWVHLVVLLTPALVLLVAIALNLFSHQPVMSVPSLSNAIAAELLAPHQLELQSLETIQSLWAGYGEICRVIATPNGSRDLSLPVSAALSQNAFTHRSVSALPQEASTYILKLVTPPPMKVGDEGHKRKILSYNVEQYFYSQLAAQMPASLPIAQCLGSIKKTKDNESTITAILLDDLRVQYPVAGEKRRVLSKAQINAALDWLSGFHGFWWPRTTQLKRSALVLPPLEEVQLHGQDASDRTVWLNGGYTYLATRRMEYKRLANDRYSEWSQLMTGPADGVAVSIAEMAAVYLAPRLSGQSPTEEFQTLIHGDVKSENLFTSISGDQVAFYDFQYTGLGLGVCDLAKLFTCSIPLGMLVGDRHVPHELEMQKGEEALLKRYLANLTEVSGKEYSWPVFMRHWEIALVDWLRFQASWGFWGNTEWLEARVRSILRNEGWRQNLLTNVHSAQYFGSG